MVENGIVTYNVTKNNYHLMFEITKICIMIALIFFYMLYIGKEFNEKITQRYYHIYYSFRLYGFNSQPIRYNKENR